MKKKKIMAIALTAVSAVMGIGVAGVALGNSGLIAPTYAADHDASHTLVEKPFFAPTTTSTGERAHWHCNDCCLVSADQARYSYAAKEHVSEAEITLAKLEAADAPNAEDDEIANVNTKKFKYVDQGANGKDASSDNVDSTPCFVKDGGRTAIYFSRSNKTGDPVNPKGNENCSEFRFTVPEGSRKVKSASFWYRYCNYGTGSWAGGGSASEPVGFTALCQFKDTAYVGHDISSKLLNDDAWHQVTIAYSGGTTANFTDFILKFTELRGYIMVSGLSYELAPVTVALKNVAADNVDGSAEVEIGSLPEAPTMSGKKFLGWYDESGNEVESVSTTTTALVARWTDSYYDDSNAKVLTFTNNQSDYTTPEGVNAAYAVRSDADIQSDVNTWNIYPGTPEGSQGFYPGDTYNASLGLGLPAFDFSKVSGVHFTFGFSAGVWYGTYLNGNSLGKDSCDQSGFTEYKYKNYEVTITGKSVSVYNNCEKNTVAFELDDDTYTGKKGLEIKTTQCCQAWLFLTPFVTLDCDYLSLMPSIETALPDTPVAGYSDQLKKYKALSDCMTTYEKANFITSKMQAWLDAANASATKVLEFTDSGASILSGITGSGSAIAAQGSGYSVENSLQFSMNGMDGSYVTMTLPAFNYSSYDKVTFTMGLGGGAGDRTAKYWLGTIPETTTQYPIPDSLMQLDNFIGIAPYCDPTGGNWNTEFTTVTISGGKAMFSSSSINKTLSLSDDVNTGKAGLILTVGWCSWNTFVITPFYASVVSIN